MEMPAISTKGESARAFILKWIKDKLLENIFYAGSMASVSIRTYENSQPYY